MARTKSSSVIEDLFALAAMLPWWLSAIAAPIAYFVLHTYAVAEIPVAVAPAQMGAMVSGQFIKTFATIGQYALPLILLAASITSFIARRKRERLAVEAMGSEAASAIRRMSWHDFELLVGEAFRLRGYTVAERGGGGADGGIDLSLTKGGETFLVQCKHWRGYKVSVSVVRELFGVMAAQGATGGFVVTSGEFTPEARQFAAGRNIELIDGKRLHRMIESAHNKVRSPQFSEAPPTVIPPDAAAADASPSCPRCGGTMVKRVAKQGPNAGGKFWGCSGYPKCRGVLPASRG